MRIRSIGTTLAFCIVGAAIAIAANPQIGTWKLNEAKSKLPGVAKNNLVVYTEVGDNVKVAIDGEDADGKTYHSEWIREAGRQGLSSHRGLQTDARSYKVVDASYAGVRGEEGRQGPAEWDDRRLSRRQVEDGRLPVTPTPKARRSPRLRSDDKQ